MYDDTALGKELTLLDVGYIYAWRRSAPMRLFYRVNDLESPLFPIQTALTLPATEKINPEPIYCEPPVQNQTLNSSIQKESPCKSTEQLINNPPETNNLRDDSIISGENKAPIEEESIKPTLVEINKKSQEIIDQEHSKTVDQNASTVPHPEAMSVNCSIQYNNQNSNQTFNENLTITAMMESIGRNTDTNEKPKSPQSNHLYPMDQTPKLEPNSQLEVKMNIEKHNQESVPNKTKDHVKENKEQQVSIPFEQIPVPIPSEVALPNKENSEKVANSFLITEIALDNSNKLAAAVPNENKKTKSKKNPAAPGSAGGVAKKKKDALTTIQNHNGKVTDGVSAPIQPKKVKNNFNTFGQSIEINASIIKIYELILIRNKYL